MNKADFMKLKPGDKLRYNDQEFHIQFTETAVDPEFEVSGVHKVYNERGQSIELTDGIVEHTFLVSEPAAKHMIRIDLVISGIDPDSNGWEFMEQAIEEAIESYGGEVTEYNAFDPNAEDPPPVDYLLNQDIL